MWSLVLVSVIIGVPVVIIVFSICKAVRREKAGEPWIVPLLIAVVFMIILSGFMFISIMTYITRAKNTSSSIPCRNYSVSAPLPLDSIDPAV